MTRDLHPVHLFVPAIRPDLTRKATRSGASAIIIDLEDSVPMAEKGAARGALSEQVPTVTGAGLVACVRVNNDPAWLAEDLAAAVDAGTQVIVFPKAESAEQICDVATQLERHEREAHRDRISLELQVETARGLLAAPQLAPASDRVTSLMLGVEDFSLDLGVDPEDPDGDLGWAHAQLLLAARATGVTAYGLLSNFSDFTDVSAYAEAAHRSRSFGYAGAYCIHPAQVGPALKAFGVSGEQIEHAERVLAAYHAAEQEGMAAVALDGRMVDRPIAERARQLLDRAAAIDRAFAATATNNTPTDKR